MSHVLESQVPIADGQRAERLPQCWLLRLLCSGLSLLGRAPSFKLSLPLSSVGSRAGGGGAGVAGVRLAQKWAVSTFCSAGVSPTVAAAGSTAALPEASPRLSG